jgi:hypothetical protein
VGYVVQLLLVALYMSTYDEKAVPDQHAVSAHLTTHNARNGNIISNHRRPATRQPIETAQRALVATAKQVYEQYAPLSPPAKKTNPDANDAAARPLRACPRPLGYVVQLLLVALYMSTYDDGLSPDQHAVSAHLTTHHSRNGNIISNHRKPARRQPTTTTQRALVATAR